jgi:hypothetical protein
MMGLILLAAILGFLGPGLLSSRTTTASDGSLRVQYHITERYESPARLRLYLRGASYSDDIVRISISNVFTRATIVEGIDPKPESVELRGDRTIYTFRVRDVGPDDCISYRYQNNQFGPVSFEVGLIGHEPVAIEQFVVP